MPVSDVSRVVSISSKAATDSSCARKRSILRIVAITVVWWPSIVERQTSRTYSPHRETRTHLPGSYGVALSWLPRRVRIYLQVKCAQDFLHTEVLGRFRGIKVRARPDSTGRAMQARSVPDPIRRLPSGRVAVNRHHDQIRLARLCLSQNRIARQAPSAFRFHSRHVPKFFIRKTRHGHFARSLALLNRVRRTEVLCSRYVMVQREVDGMEDGEAGAKPANEFPDERNSSLRLAREVYREQYSIQSEHR